MGKSKKNLAECFIETSEKIPKKIALIDGDKTVDFSSLRKYAFACAKEIIEQTGGVKNKPVAIFLPKCIEAVVADIACVLSANMFMNLDVKTPLNRLRNICDLVKPVLVLTTEEFRPQAEAVVGDSVPIVEINVSTYKKVNNIDIFLERLECQIDTDPICIINTSGSTGTPKGVVLSHRSFFDFLSWSKDVFGFDGSEIIGSLSPVVFDIYDHELFLVMTEGSTMVMLDARLAAFPAKLLKEMQEKKVNYIFWVPSIMVSIANMDLLSRIELPELKLIWFAGEVFPTKQFNYWKRNLPHAVFVNLYGPIEITLDCTYYIVDRDFPDGEPLPIGYPCRNTDVLILDDDDNLCDAGEKGELCVRGSSLALGYYNNPEKTAAAFVQNPCNSSYPELIYRTGDIVYCDDRSEIKFCGRKDSLIKHMGYRIELGEIEHVIVNTLALVKYCCAVHDKERDAIILYYETSKDIPVETFRSSLSACFPKYMIPNSFVRMDELPRNTNGKIDRLFLSEMGKS